MEKFTVLRSRAVPWLMPNVDTDTITPMKRILLNMEELGKYSFEPYRYVGGDGDRGELNMEFPLNMHCFQNAGIMITGENFGCGSSRETAPEAIRRIGIRCLVGSSFGGIFQKNCYQQGILPITLTKDEVEWLAELAKSLEEFTVDLPSRTLYAPDGGRYLFTLPEIRYRSLSEGLDDVGMTLEKLNSILQYFKQDSVKRRWLYN